VSPLGPSGFERAQHRPTPRPSVEGGKAGLLIRKHCTLHANEGGQTTRRALAHNHPEGCRGSLWCFGALYQTHIVAPGTPNSYGVIHDKLRMSSPVLEVL